MLKGLASKLHELRDQSLLGAKHHSLIKPNRCLNSYLHTLAGNRLMQRHQPTHNWNLKRIKDSNQIEQPARPNQTPTKQASTHTASPADQASFASVRENPTHNTMIAGAMKIVSIIATWTQSNPHATEVPELEAASPTERQLNAAAIPMRPHNRTPTQTLTDTPTHTQTHPHRSKKQRRDTST